MGCRTRATSQCSQSLSIVFCAIFRTGICHWFRTLWIYCQMIKYNCINTATKELFNFHVAFVFLLNFHNLFFCAIFRTWIFINSIKNKRHVEIKKFFGCSVNKIVLHHLTINSKSSKPVNFFYEHHHRFSIKSHFLYSQGNTVIVC